MPVRKPKECGGNGGSGEGELGKLHEHMSYDIDGFFGMHKRWDTGKPATRLRRWGTLARVLQELHRALGLVSVYCAHDGMGWGGTVTVTVTGIGHTLTLYPTKCAQGIWDCTNGICTIV